MSTRSMAVCVVAAALLFAVTMFVACGSGSTGTRASSATVALSLSDPPTCSVASSGAYAHLYVTVSDVLINASATAGDNDFSWVDLTPNLKSAPQHYWPPTRPRLRTISAGAPVPTASC